MSGALNGGEVEARRAAAAARQQALRARRRRAGLTAVTIWVPVGRTKDARKLERLLQEEPGASGGDPIAALRPRVTDEQLEAFQACLDDEAVQLLGKVAAILRDAPPVVRDRFVRRVLLTEDDLAASKG